MTDKKTRIAFCLLGFSILMMLTSGCGHLWTAVNARAQHSTSLCAWSGFQSDAYTYPGGTSAFGNSITRDTLGNLFSVGAAEDGGNLRHWITRKSADDGLTWITVDDYFNVTGDYMGVSSFADASNAIYTLGFAVEGDAKFHWITRKSADHGATWASMDDYLYPGSSINQPYMGGADLAGNIYVVGSGSPAGSIHWVVRKSTNGGTTWSTVDNYLFPGGAASVPTGFTVDSLGSIFVAGAGTDASANSRWVVRKSPDNGTTWATVDNFLYPGGTSSGPSGISVDSQNNLYATGTGQDASAHTRWVTRKSGDHGVTWATVDDYQYTGSTDSEPWAVTADAANNLYITGAIVDAGGHNRWIIRKSIDQGVTWNIFDDYSYGTATNSSAFAFGIDAAGNLFANGKANDDGTNSLWYTRKYTCQ